MIWAVFWSAWKWTAKSDRAGMQVAVGMLKPHAKTLVRAWRQLRDGNIVDGARHAQQIELPPPLPAEKAAKGSEDVDGARGPLRGTASGQSVGTVVGGSQERTTPRQQPQQRRRQQRLAAAPPRSPRGSAGLTNGKRRSGTPKTTRTGRARTGSPPTSRGRNADRAKPAPKPEPEPGLSRSSPHRLAGRLSPEVESRLHRVPAHRQAAVVRGGSAGRRRGGVTRGRA